MCSWHYITPGMGPMQFVTSLPPLVFLMSHPRLLLEPPVIHQSYAPCNSPNNTKQITVYIYIYFNQGNLMTCHPTDGQVPASFEIIVTLEIRGNLNFDSSYIVSQPRPTLNFPQTPAKLFSRFYNLCVFSGFGMIWWCESTPVRKRAEYDLHNIDSSKNEQLMICK